MNLRIGHQVVETTFLNSLRSSSSLVSTLLQSVVPNMLGTVERFVEVCASLTLTHLQLGDAEQ